MTYSEEMDAVYAAWRKNDREVEQQVLEKVGPALFGAIREGMRHVAVHDGSLEIVYEPRGL